MEHKKLVSRIAQLREQAGLTQRELALLLGVSESTIANYETGRNDLEWIERTANLCKFLNCQPEDLYTKIEYTPDSEPPKKRKKGRSLEELRNILHAKKTEPNKDSYAADDVNLKVKEDLGRCSIDKKD